MSARGNNGIGVKARVAQMRVEADARKEAHRIVSMLGAESVGREVTISYGHTSEVVLMVAITAADAFDAAAAAWQRMQASGLNGSPDEKVLYERLETIENVARSLRDPETRERLFESGKDLEAVLPEILMTQLAEEYADIVETIELVEESQVEPLLELLKKKETIPLKAIVPTLPRRLLDTLAVQLLNCVEGKFSFTESSAE